MTRQQWEELFEKHEEPTDETHAEWLEELMIKQTVNELRRILGRVPVLPWWGIRQNALTSSSSSSTPRKQ